MIETANFVNGAGDDGAITPAQAALGYEVVEPVTNLIVASIASYPRYFDFVLQQKRCTDSRSYKQSGLNDYASIERVS